MKQLLAIAEQGATSEERLAMVLAAAGVLTAAGWDWRSPFDPDRAARTMAAFGAKRLWMPPPPSAYRLIGALAAELVAAWERSFGDAAGQGPTRLLLSPHRAWTEDERPALAAMSHAMLGGLLRWRGRVPEWRHIDPATIGSIAIRSNPAAGGSGHWRWPLRLALEGIEPADIENGFGPIGRGIARPVTLRAPSEYAVVRSLDGLDAARASLATLISARREAVGEPLLRSILERATTPLAWIEDAQLDPEGFASALIYETAHDAAPDLALTLAWLREGGQSTPPIVFAGHDFFAQMDAARLSQSVQDLSRQLQALGSADDTPLPIPPGAAHSFGIVQGGDLRPSQLADAISRAVEADAISYASEDHAARATAEVSNLIDARIVDTRRSAEVAAEPEPAHIPPTGGRSVEADRYGDACLLDGHWWPGDVFGDEDRHPLDAPLDPDSQYTLEVAIRAETLAPGEERTPVEPPREGNETVTLYARVIARTDIRLEDELLPITWPFDEDSSSALFRFSTDRGFEDGALIEVRLLTGDLRLLDQFKYVFEDRTWRLRQVDRCAKMGRPAPGTARDALSLAVSGTAGGYAVHAELVRDGQPPLALSLRQSIRPADVAKLLGEVRRHWTRLVLGTMSNSDGLSEPSFRQTGEALARYGRAAWRLLFGNRTGSQAGAGEAFGALLARHPLPRDAFVRISFSDDALDFAFPWTILTPPPQPTDKAAREPWGLSYQIEIARPQGRTPAPRSSALRITALVDDGFSRFVDHRRTLAEIVTARRGIELAPADVNREITAALGAENPSDIFYFFCHGMMASAQPALLAEMQAEITTALQPLDEAAKEPWRFLLGALAGTDGGARISSSRADLNEMALGDIEFFKNRCRPLVFLNMCHSVSSVPGSRMGLPAMFLDRDAIAVIGAEAPITARFGDAFARHLLGQLFDGEALGTAMLSARRAFDAQRNPLALIYTLYGRSDMRFVPPVPGCAPFVPDAPQKETTP
ncbi:hypothetical protein MWN34_17715 [Ancylobacter sp. 6x-1]|uniref:CHAT domain-containing protein n=1 Tax=Ancylobacter crimeensis TaxID=2579147 RepID=A0ABT0DFS4_9HYPH|nr:hypothetical protein [Ancylobacter crimeensis]MCK0198739.1 hypothetical protein [Ancylobacter crimeensis]